MGKKVYFADAYNSADQNQRAEFLLAIKKRKNILLLLSLIPIVHLVTTGMFIITNNTYRELALGKRRGGILNLIMVVWGLFIFPLVVTFILGHSYHLSVATIGVKKLLKDWKYVE